MNLFFRSLLALALVGTTCISAALEQDYPTKPIKLIVPFPPGGGSDLVARAFTEKLSVRLGKPMVVDNKPGAGANIGAEAAAKSAPDGYTLFFSAITNQAIAVSYYRKLGYDYRRDFTPISMVSHGTTALIVPASLNVTSVKELIALAKAKPGQLSFASSGVGSIVHLTGELFKQKASVDIVHVPYKGTAQFQTDLMAGTVDMTLDNLPSHLQYIKSGKLRALAVASVARSPLLPEVPTLAEAGLSGIVVSTISALLAPTGTPKDIIARLNRETNVVLQQADLREKLATQGLTIYGSSPEAVQKVIQDEIAKWAKVIKDGNIQPE